MNNIKESVSKLNPEAQRELRDLNLDSREILATSNELDPVDTAENNFDSSKEKRFHQTKIHEFKQSSLSEESNPTEQEITARHISEMKNIINKPMSSFYETRQAFNKVKTKFQKQISEL